MRQILITALVLAPMMLCPSFLHDANAQTVDMWTGQAIRDNQFTPHLNTCNTTTEVFVAIGGGTKGYCMDKDISVSTAIWSEAKEACASVRKRLPEPAEFQFACNHPPTGLNSMLAAYEWVSNSSTILYVGVSRISVPLMGNGSCSYGDWADVGDGSNVSSLFQYRCVH